MNVNDRNVKRLQPDSWNKIDAALTAGLADSRQAIQNFMTLDDCQRANEQLTAEVKLLREQLDIAGRTVAEQQKTVRELRIRMEMILSRCYTLWSHLANVHRHFQVPTLPMHVTFAWQFGFGRAWELFRDKRLCTGAYYRRVFAPHSAELIKRGYK